jgi:hypothetical protein
MTTTISVDDETKRRFDDTRPEDFRSAGEFVEELLNCYEAIHGDRPDPADAEAHRESFPDDVRDQLDRIEEAQGGTVAEALDLAEVDADAIADAVAARGVSLDVSERKAIAEEVVGILR